nr:dual specificity protein phosphatase CDC14B-like isoform X1 [Dermatophagoides farinae]
MSISASSSSSSAARQMSRHSMTFRSPSKNFPTTLLEMVKERSLHFTEFLTNRLYFATVSEVNLNLFLKKSDSIVCFLHFDKELLYTPFNHDFGPLNLAMLYRYCKKINSHLQRNKTIIHLTTTNRFKRVNAAYLIGSYCIIYHHLLPDDVMARLKQLSISYVAYKTFAAFVDAGFDTSEYYLYLEDCFNAIYKAAITEILNMEKFNLNEYLFYEKVENGDLNWIVPGKFIAFCDPQTYSDHSTNHYVKLYINFFRKNNITTIIRLNKSRYDPKVFTDKGFQHYNLIFIDGGVPGDHIVDEFLHIAETNPGAMAVHCKAGLGRTGTMIACYLMKHWHFTALEAIAWIRICRPGSIVGYQQKWLKLKQNFLWNHHIQQTLIQHQHLHLDLNNIKQQRTIQTGRPQRTGQSASTRQETFIMNNDDDDDDMMINSNKNNDDSNNNDNPTIITIVKCHLLNVQPDLNNSVTTSTAINNSIDENNFNHNTNTNTNKISGQNGSCFSISSEMENNNNIIMADNDNENSTTTLTQGDYLNQIKLMNNRKRQLRMKINHWFHNNNNNNNNNSHKSSIQSTHTSCSSRNNNGGIRKTNNQTMMMMMMTPSSSDIRSTKNGKMANNPERKSLQMANDIDTNNNYNNGHS